MIARLLLAVFAVELVDATGRIHDLLLAGIERMTGRAHFDVQLGRLDSRSCRERVAAAAGHVYFRVFGMDIRFHFGRSDAAISRVRDLSRTGARRQGASRDRAPRRTA